MVNRRFILVAAGIVACLVVVFLLRRDRPEVVIERTFLELAREGEKTGDEGLLAIARRVATITDGFTSNAVLQVGPPYPVRVTRAELPALLHRVRTYADSIRIDVRGTEIEVQPGGRRAEMLTTVELSGTVEGRSDRGIAEYRILWERVGSKTWKIAQLEPRATIHHPADGSAWP